MKEELIQTILKLRPFMQYEKLSELSYEALVLIRVHIEFEEFGTGKEKKDDKGNKPG